MPEGERRLAAIMYTDIVGYTALGQRSESFSIAVVEELKKLIRPILARHNGREVKMIGDAFLVVFPNALDSVRCAYDIQRCVRELDFSLPEERRVQLRVGIHVGEIVESADDISGDAVNVASRIQSLATGGSVCLTRQVYDHVHNKFELPLESLGAKSLKNVSAPVEVYQMVMPWKQEKDTRGEEPNKKRIAVLPFANLSPDPADKYFADGMAEELITSLSGVRELTVIARTSVMKYRDGLKGASEIGRELNAGTLLEGSVRKAGKRVRITVQLTDSVSEGHVWAKNFDRDLDDIFAIQSEIAESVARELSVQLVESEKRGLERRPTESTEAYTYYLRARYNWNTRSEGGLDSSIKYFEEAIRRDPDYALALVGLADCYSISALFGYARPRPAYVRAEELATKAIQVGDGFAEAHASMGEILMHYSYDWVAAARELERALQINPNYATAHAWRSTCYAVWGQFEGAMAEARRAQELDPFAVSVMNEVGKNLYYARRYDDAIKHFVRSIGFEPNSAYLHKSLAETYAQKSMFEQAMNEMERALVLSGRSAFILDAATCVFALAHEESRSRELMSELDKTAAVHFVPVFGRAGAYLALGDRSRAMQLLETAYNERSWLAWLKVDPTFDEMKGEEAFHTLLRRMGLEMEQTSTLS